ncbi:ABC transporter ATP-binding protein [Streptomyces sp. NBC_01465]|uniref:ABC transporter ATP-binding protein n=1 Tax=Streptomyces sp. NBC_01465 TaxID=2903878 RepID=UPI002E2F24EE|nr:ABC transporter ATP-binding protein [Streptomyces sp. NBC_01465]
MAFPEELTRATQSGAPPALHLREVTRRYGRGNGTVHALRGVSVALPAGSFTSIMGPSGSGKSTFLRCAAGLDKPTSGEVFLGQTDISRMSERKLTLLRRERIGFVFQAFNLVPSLSAQENILLPFRLARRRPDRDWVRTVIERTHLTDRLKHRPAELSGGQQQRVAVARALATRPEVVFADEPTGALDLTSGHEVLSLLREIVDSMGQTLVMVTHDPNAAARADRVLFLADGSIVDTMDRPSQNRVADRMSRLGA